MARLAAREPGAGDRHGAGAHDPDQRGQPLRDVAAAAVAHRRADRAAGGRRRRRASASTPTGTACSTRPRRAPSAFDPDGRPEQRDAGVHARRRLSRPRSDARRRVAAGHRPAPDRRRRSRTRSPGSRRWCGRDPPTTPASRDCAPQRDRRGRSAGDRARRPARATGGCRGDRARRRDARRLPQCGAAVPRCGAASALRRSHRRARAEPIGRRRRWLSNETTGTLAEIDAQLPAVLDTSHRFVQTRDGRAIALAGQHGAVYETLPFGD